MESSGIVVYFQGVGDYMAVLVYRGGGAAHLPAERQLDSDVVDLLERVVKIDGVHAVAVIEQVLFGRAEQAHRHQRPAAGG